MWEAGLKACTTNARQATRTAMKRMRMTTNLTYPTNLTNLTYPTNLTHPTRQYPAALSTTFSSGWPASKRRRFSEKSSTSAGQWAAIAPEVCGVTTTLGKSQ